MYIRVNKNLVENKKCVSEKMFAPVVLYVSLVKNIYDTSYFSLGDIMNYFKIKRTTKNLDAIKSSINSFLEEQLFRQVYGTDVDNIGVNDLVGIEIIDAKKENFNQAHFDDVELLIDVCDKEGELFSLITLYLVIKRNSFTHNYNENNKSTDITETSYSAISKISGIKSNTTISKYVKLLETYGIFTVKRDTGVSDEINKETGELEKIFKTKNTYTFKEREME